MFRKYDAQGRLVFERHVEGDRARPVRAGPSDDLAETNGRGRRTAHRARLGPNRRGRPGRQPLDLAGVPYTYVYDGNGDKQRTIQFRAAGIIAVNGFFFTQGSRASSSRPAATCSLVRRERSRAREEPRRERQHAVLTGRRLEQFAVRVDLHRTIELERQRARPAGSARAGRPRGCPGRRGAGAPRTPASASRR